MSAPNTSAAALLLAKQLKDLQKNGVPGISVGLCDESNLFEWQVMIVGPPDTYYENGIFNALLTFPPDFPSSPPKMRFTTKIFHPNIYENGEVCISILHPPGEDKWGYERPEERWLPVHSVETILISVISMLSDPNDQSPANIEAAKLWRENREAFKKRVKKCVEQSLEL